MIKFDQMGLMTGRNPVIPSKPLRLRREEKTIEVMTAMYCQSHSATDGASPLCAQCAQFLKYARKRIEYCRYGVQKPACSECPNHCYIPEQKEMVRKIMHYAGPRIITSHPILALLHVWDKYMSRLRIRWAKQKDPLL